MKECELPQLWGRRPERDSARMACRGLSFRTSLRIDGQEALDTRLPTVTNAELPQLCERHLRPSLIGLFLSLRR